MTSGTETILISDFPIDRLAKDDLEQLIILLPHTNC